jgi:hypothetical protein
MCAGCATFDWFFAWHAHTLQLRAFASIEHRRQMLVTLLQLATGMYKNALQARVNGPLFPLRDMCSVMECAFMRKDIPSPAEMHPSKIM